MYLILFFGQYIILDYGETEVLKTRLFSRIFLQLYMNKLEKYKDEVLHSCLRDIVPGLGPSTWESTRVQV